MTLEAVKPTSSPTQVSAAPSPRLVKAAHEFEGQMMKELMKPLNHHDPLLASDDDDSGSNGALGEFASESLAQAMSQHGGLGLATSILKDFAWHGYQTASGVTSNRHPDTVIKAHQ